MKGLISVFWAVGLALLGGCSPSAIFPAETPPTSTSVPESGSCSVLSLNVAPSEINPGEKVDVWVVVVNTSDAEVPHTVTLKIDGVVEASKDVTVPPNGSQVLNFNLYENVPGLDGLINCTYSKSIKKLYLIITPGLQIGLPNLINHFLV